MKLTRKCFAVINPLVEFALKTPLHFVFSDSIMLLTFTGRRSGRAYTTPVRYIRSNCVIRCFTSKRTRWWRNLSGSAKVTLIVAGERITCTAATISDDPEVIRPALCAYLHSFPQDAVYHNVRLNEDKTPNATDLVGAAHTAVLIEARIG